MALDSIFNTFKRLAKVSDILNGENWNSLIRGFCKEGERVEQRRKLMSLCTVPNNNLPSEAFDDYEKMYGIKKYDGFSEEQRRNVIIERSRQFYTATVDDVNLALKTAGFNFYCIANKATIDRNTQFGSEQFASFTQFNIMPQRQNPTLVPGILISGSQFESTERRITENAQYWGFVLFLSPFPNRLAKENELTALTQEEIEYLTKTLSSIKYARDWFLLQAREITR